MRWFQALLPREDKFFGYFIEHARLLLKGAEALRELLHGGDRVAECCAAIMRHEEAADEVTRNVFLAVRRTLITPFDRSDIRDLTTSLDDAIDQMQKTAKAITLFQVREFQPHMRQMGDIILRAAELTVEAVGLLGSMRENVSRLNAITEEITRLEEQADELNDAGIRALFLAHRGGDVMDFIVGNEIYDHLEKVVDRFEDVANRISGIVVEQV
jgi:uncharacterized protein